MTCSGCLLESRTTLHDISRLHAYLDVKAKENNIQGDWVGNLKLSKYTLKKLIIIIFYQKTLIVTYFPNCKETVKNFNPSLTGLLNFLRQTVENRKRESSLGHPAMPSQKSVETSPFIPHYCDLPSFFFSAFPVIALSIYRMLEGTPWMEVPIFSSFNEPFELV